jgi:hypothetical protein
MNQLIDYYRNGGTEVHIAVWLLAAVIALAVVVLVAQGMKNGKSRRNNRMFYMAVNDMWAHADKIGKAHEDKETSPETHQARAVILQYMQANPARPTGGNDPRLTLMAEKLYAMLSDYIKTLPEGKNRKKQSIRFNNDVQKAHLSGLW